MKKIKDVCYYCGKLATTNEHAPPKLMFKGFDCDSITVPSCVNHNCSKCGEDQAIVYALLSALKNYLKSNARNKTNLNRDIRKAIKIAESSFLRTKKHVISKSFLDKIPETEKHIPDVSFLKAPMDISNWIKNLTAAIIYDGVHHYDSYINWSKIKCWSAEYINSRSAKTSGERLSLLVNYKDIKKSIEDKTWMDGWSAYPRKYPKNIYCFFLHINSNEVTIKHSFYNSYIWYCWFKPSKTIMNQIKKNLKNGKITIN